jgi:protein-S-isoprenylcysteine O-methyltransferase Ste14
VLIPYLLLRRSQLVSLVTGGFGWIGLLPMALGALVYIRCAWDFTFTGKGTPAPWDPPQMFVSRSLYRIVRNPMYVGFALILLGEAMVFHSFTLLVYAVLVWTGFHLRVVYYEEPTLRKKFGVAYEDYCWAVPRWIPRFRGKT